MEQYHPLVSFAIVVLNHGSVYVGDVEFHDRQCTIKDAKNLRHWEGKNGLGHLALHGPTKSTVFEKTGIVYIPLHSIDYVIATRKVLWIS